MRFLKWIGLNLLLLVTVTAETPQKPFLNFDLSNFPTNQSAFLEELFNRKNPEINLGKLEPTQPRELSIESKTRQTFYLDLKSGQFAQVNILKGDVNLRIKVLTPNGTLLSELVSTQFGDTSIQWIAETGGRYAIQIISLERSSSKTYSLNFLTPRPATSADQEFIQYTRLFAEGEELFIEGNKKSLQLALEKYQTAFDGFRQLQSYPEAAKSAGRMGEVFLIWGDNKKAQNYFRTAFISSRKGDDKLLPIALLNLTGRSLLYSGKLSEARQITEEAFAALQKQPDYLKRGETLFEEGFANLNIGEVLYSEGDLPGSQEKFNYSIQKFKEIDDRRGQALGHLFIGYSLSDLGYIEDARSHYQEALALSENSFDIKVRAMVLTALGGNHSTRGEYRQALKYFNRGLYFFRELDDKQNEGVTLNGIARVYVGLNEPELAYEIYHQSLALFEKNNNIDFQSTTLLSLGLNCRTLGKDEEALTHYRKSFEISKFLGKRRIAAYALSFIAATADSQGKSVNAVEEFKRSLKILESIRDRKGQAETLNSIGDVYYKNGKHLQALQVYRQALKISETIDDKNLKAQNFYNIALTNRAIGQLDESLKNIEQSLSIIEALRVLIANEILRMSYFSMATKYYNFYINLLMQLHKSMPGEGYDVLAWQASEKVRSRVLLESLSLAGVKIKQTQNPELSLQEEKLTRAINDKINLHSNLIRQNKPLEEINISIQEMRRLFIEYEEIRGEINRENSSSSDFTSTETSDLAKVKEYLQNEPDSILLEYMLTDEKSFLWTITAEKIESYELPSRSEIEKTSLEYYEILSAPPPRINTSAEQSNRVETSAGEFNAKACRLSQMLIPARALPADKKRLLIVPDKTLNYISFDALPFPCYTETFNQPTAAFDYVPLIMNYETLITPSASASLVLRKRLDDQSTAPNFVAIFSDPVFEIGDSRISVGPDKSLVSEQESNEFEPAEVAGQTENFLSRLFYTSQESEQIMEMTNPAKSLTLSGFDANLSEVKNPRIKDYQILHFATHSLANNEIPEMSGIFLSKFDKNGEAVPGALRLRDIYSMDINAELIILSSCNSAVGRDISGEGLISLSRGFMSAGAKSVVGSLWKIDDQATAEMMKYFYTFIIYDKMNLSEALRTAKLKMSEQKKWQSPYFWSGFVLQGEYKNKIVVDNYRKSNLLTIVGLISVLSLIIIAIFMLRKLIKRQ